MDLKWIKLSLDVFNNDKVKLLSFMPDGESKVLCWLKILVLAGRANRGGKLYVGTGLPFTLKTLSMILGKPMDFVEETLDAMIKLEMIEKTKDGIYKVTNWNKYQGSNTKSRRASVPKRISAKNNKTGVKAEKGKVLENLKNTKKVNLSIQEEKKKKAGEEADRILKHYESILGKAIVLKREDVVEAVKIYGSAYASLAISKAIEAGKRSMSYVNGILRNWASEGFLEREMNLEANNIKPSG